MELQPPVSDAILHLALPTRTYGRPSIQQNGYARASPRAELLTGRRLVLPPSRAPFLVLLSGRVEDNGLVIGVE